MMFKKGDWVCSKRKSYSISKNKDYEVLAIFTFIDDFIMIKDDLDELVGLFSEQFEISPRNISKQRHKKLERLNNEKE